MTQIELVRDQSEESNGIVSPVLEQYAWGQYVDGKPNGFAPFGGDVRQRIENGWAFAWYVGGGFLRVESPWIAKNPLRVGDLLIVPANQKPLSQTDPICILHSTGLGCESIDPLTFAEWQELVERGAVIHLDRGGAYSSNLQEMSRLLTNFSSESSAGGG